MRPPFRLPGHGLRESSWERPHETWRCGRASAGLPCAAGPRPDGRCSQDDEPCRPRRSARAWRVLLGRMVLLAVAGVLAFVLASPQWAEWLSPGPLAMPHARLGRVASLTGTPVACGSCHPDAEAGPSSWLRALVSGRTGPSQTDLCVRCHAPGVAPRHAHGRPPEEMAALTAAILSPPPPGGAPADGTPAAPEAAVPVASAVELPCARCHDEHRGSGHDLSGVSASACGSCHARDVASFADGHPEFDGFPYRRGTRVLFDHNTHRAENFRKERNRRADRPFECEGCHRPGPEGRQMVLRPFEETCTVCHGEQVREGPGLTVVNLTGVDPGARPGNGRWPSEEESWPAPLLALLLRGGGIDTDDLALLDEIDPLDLSDTEPEEREAVSRYMAAVRELFVDLGERGQPAFERRAAAVLGGPVPSVASGHLSPDTFEAARRVWFDTTARDGSDVGAPTAVEPEQRLPHGGWYRRDADFTIRYRPLGHADAFLRAWIEIGAAHPDDPDAAALLSLLQEETAPGRCLKCHVAVTLATARAATGTASVEPIATLWSPAATGDPRLHFSHASHVRALGGTGTCVRCHVMVSDARDQAARTEDLPGSQDFIPMDRALCQSCHGRKGAGDGCLDCHRYHWPSGVRSGF